MVTRPSIVCSTDFSDASRGAVRWATAIAEHFYATLTVVSVNDPLLADAADATYGVGWMKAHTFQSLETFLKETLRRHAPNVPELNLETAVGKPAPELLRIARIKHADLVVMSSHGATGLRKQIFGSTTERLLRTTTIPVLVTAPEDPGPASLDEIRRMIRTVLAPVDLTAATPRQLQIARGAAEALGASLVLAHVLEPTHASTDHQTFVARIDAMRMLDTRRTLDDLQAGLLPGVQTEVVLASGTPSIEIARIAREKQAGVVVMGLHSSAGGGPRMGSVTYRVLCEAQLLVLAIPPAEMRAMNRMDVSAARRTA